MIHFRTLLQRRILNYYWKNSEPFTIDSLCEKKIVHCRLWGRFSLKMMEFKHQIIRITDPRDGGKKFIGTTECREEWRGLLAEKRHSLFTPLIEEDMGAGMNRYEIDEMIQVLENARKMILERQKLNAQSGGGETPNKENPDQK